MKSKRQRPRPTPSRAVTERAFRLGGRGSRRAEDLEQVVYGPRPPAHEDVRPPFATLKKGRTYPEISSEYRSNTRLDEMIEEATVDA